MFLEDQEEISCEYCGKTTKATEAMKPWINVSEVVVGTANHWPGLFCSYDCLRAWLKEPFSYRIERERQMIQYHRWREEDREGVKKLKIEALMVMTCPKLEDKKVPLEECAECEYHKGVEDQAVVICDFP